jgi:hypothetical protein
MQAAHRASASRERMIVLNKLNVANDVALATPRIGFGERASFVVETAGLYQYDLANIGV